MAATEEFRKPVSQNGKPATEHRKHVSGPTEKV